ncbi:unnamed protein product [Gongylonema pulchrum]|uniref:EGF-like domain-containing protein n=1 Tax=Gongylonema pulchrum TaxID=637853 RepID=A0A183DAM4_9BILA|nr:unnamed protein product [Gongylonema pulchrum]
MTGLTGMMSNNYRIYGTAILLFLFVIVALAIFAGALVKSIVPASHSVCFLNGLLLQASAYVPSNASSDGDLCPYCNANNTAIIEALCHNSTCEQPLDNHTFTCKPAFPGIASGAFIGKFSITS